MSDEEELFSPHPAIVVRSLRADPNYVKCPRCWHMHTVKLNYDCLCDRCCRVLMQDWPDHESVPFIKVSLEAQKRHFERK